MAKHSRFRLTRAGLPCAALLVLGLGLTPLAAHAQTYTDLHDFNINAGDPFTFVNGRLAEGVTAISTPSPTKGEASSKAPSSSSHPAEPSPSFTALLATPTANFLKAASPSAPMATFMAMRKPEVPAITEPC